MSTVTIEQIKAKQSEIAQLIEQFQHQAELATVSIDIEECSIRIAPGEHYAGAILDGAGQHMHHLVLMAARSDDDLTWQQAMEWAASVNGTLPTRQEQALLFANCKPHLKPEWHWSSEVYEKDASYAWSCYFTYGYQNLSHKSYEGGAVAVRRV